MILYQKVKKGSDLLGENGQAVAMTCLVRVGF